jgi:hypothetical protein
MKKTLHSLVMLALFAGFGSSVRAQLSGPAAAVSAPGSSAAPAQNLVIFLMDGYRWQELYRGADSALAFNSKYNRIDSAWTMKKYWAPDVAARRKLLMPFVWETIAANGQLYGNRDLGSLVNVRNKFQFSYPGRSEAFCGYYDPAVNSNEFPDNPNTNVLEFIDKQPGFHGKVATFSSWDADARIFNRKRNRMLVNIYGEDITGKLTPLEKEANILQHMLPDIFGGGERLDAGTFALAKAYMLANHPRVLYIDLGDPDDFAHAGDYGDYLDAAHDADAMFRDIWNILEQDDFYKGKTTMLIFPDHGRGEGPQWTDHGEEVGPSGQTYFMAMGAGVPVRGEVHGDAHLYQEQYAQTIAKLLGLNFTAEHPVAEAIQLGVR